MFFSGVNDLYSGGNPALAEDFTHAAGHSAVAGGRNIVNLDLARIKLVGSTHAGDNRYPLFTAEFYQGRLGGKVVDGVQHVIGLWNKQLFGIFPGEKGLDRIDLCGGIDVAQSLRHDFDLGSANCAGKGMDLPVDVGQADVVEIDQCDMADTGPSQRFSGVAADPADAADHDMLISQRGKTGFTY